MTFPQKYPSLETRFSCISTNLLKIDVLKFYQKFTFKPIISGYYKGPDYKLVKDIPKKFCSLKMHFLCIFTSLLKKFLLPLFKNEHVAPLLIKTQENFDFSQDFIDTIYQYFLQGIFPNTNHKFPVLYAKFYFSPHSSTRFGASSLVSLTVFKYHY